MQEQGYTVEGALDAAHVTINSKATSVVIFLLHGSSMQRNDQRWDEGRWKVILTQRPEWRWVGSGRISGQGVSRYCGGDVTLSVLGILLSGSLPILTGVVRFICLKEGTGQENLVCKYDCFDYTIRQALMFVLSRYS